MDTPKPIWPNDAAGIASIKSANNTKRTERLICIFLWSNHPGLPGVALLLRVARI